MSGEGGVEDKAAIAKEARLGPKAAEDDLPGLKLKPKPLSLRAILPNAITAAALCSGLTGVRFAIGGEWDSAVLAVLLAGVLDGVDGRIARLLNAQSRFGAELDSLADSLSFGMAPALITYLWVLNESPRFGWLVALAFALSCALRLARFNAQIDTDDQPHKRAGFLTGVPAPVGAGLAFLPFFLWKATGQDYFRDAAMVTIWMGIIAFLMISNIATLSWGAIRPKRQIRLGLILFLGLLCAALLTEVWWTLSVICAVYLALIPLGIYRYSKVKLR